MEYRQLGRSGLDVSVICLGAMNFGELTDAAAAERIIGHAGEQGVNFIDTADVYVKGRSEEIVGKGIAGNRRHWILATKVGNPMSSHPMDRGYSRRWITQAIDNSLRRLGTDYIDIYYLHKDDARVPPEETLGAIADILRAGKARYFGISNYWGWRIADTVHRCQRMGMPAPVVVQPYYNAFNRQPEVEVLAACAHFGLGVVSYSPLARGVLTGKYRPGAEAPADSRVARKDKRMMETEFREESLALAQRFAEHARKKGMTPTEFALAWLLRNRTVTSVLAGPRTFDQWTGYLGAVGRTIDDDDEALVDSMAPPGHPTTPGYWDPQYPFYGRVTG